MLPNSCLHLLVIAASVLVLVLVLHTLKTGSLEAIQKIELLGFFYHMALDSITMYDYFPPPPQVIFTIPYVFHAKSIGFA